MRWKQQVAVFLVPVTIGLLVAVSAMAAEALDSGQRGQSGWLAIIGHSVFGDPVALLIDQAEKVLVSTGSNDVILVKLPKGLHKIEAFWRERNLSGSRKVFIKPDNIVILGVENGVTEGTGTTVDPHSFDCSKGVDPSTGRCYRGLSQTYTYTTPYLTIEFMEQGSRIYLSEDEFYQYLSNLGFDPSVKERACDACAFPR